MSIVLKITKLPKPRPITLPSFGQVVSYGNAAGIAYVLIDGLVTK